MTNDTALPVTYDCDRDRHKVLAGDGICVVCGAQNVVDARALPPVPVIPLGDAPIGPGPDDRVRRIAHRLLTELPYRARLAGILATESDGGTAIVREVLHRFDAPDRRRK